MTLLVQGPDLEEHKRRAHRSKAGALATSWTPALFVGQVRYEGCHRLYSPRVREGVFSETELPISCILGNSPLDSFGILLGNSPANTKEQKKEPRRRRGLPALFVQGALVQVQLEFASWIINRIARRARQRLTWPPIDFRGCHSRWRCHARQHHDRRCRKHHPL